MSAFAQKKPPVGGESPVIAATLPYLAYLRAHGSEAPHEAPRFTAWLKSEREHFWNREGIARPEDRYAEARLAAETRSEFAVWLRGRWLNPEPAG